MSKHNSLVQIPVGHICIQSCDFFNMKLENYRQLKKIVELDNQLAEVNVHVTALEVDLAASEAKVADLEKELNEKQDRFLYWYQKYTDLSDKLNAVKPDAKTEET